MGVQLFRAVDGGGFESQRFDEYSYLHELDNGWCYSPQDCLKETPEDKENKEINELRKTAKAAGIKSWHLKSVDTLKNELSAIEE